MRVHGTSATVNESDLVTEVEDARDKALQLKDVLLALSFIALRYTNVLE